MAFIIESKFIGDFKIGDNINHNLKILEVMYKQYAEASDAEKRLLCKPTVVLLVSLIDGKRRFDSTFSLRKG